MQQITLRPYQEQAIAAVRAAYRHHRRVLLVAPTGFGKTATAAALIRWAVAKGRRVVFVVHRREIVLDTARRIPGAGVVMAGHPVTSAFVQVCSIQTLVAREAHPPADLLIWDEAHHCAAETYREIAAQYPGAWHLGLTATPERADGVGLRDAFDAIIVGATVKELQAGGYLAECDVIAATTRESALAMDPVEAWHQYAGGRPTVAFHRLVAESKEFASRLGPMAAHIDGVTHSRERDSALAAFAAGELTVLSNVYVLTEGWDAPRAKVCLLARGCGAEGTYIQMVGRVLRRHGDERALVIDLAGVVRDHGMPDEDRDFTLDGIHRKGKDDREWLCQCRTCGAVVRGVARGPACRCGAPWPPPPATAIESRPVVAVAAVATRRERMAALDTLTATARARGYKPGWVGMRFKERFGFWPKGLS